jgi:hypothetical protein
MHSRTIQTGFVLANKQENQMRKVILAATTVLFSAALAGCEAPEDTVSDSAESAEEGDVADDAMAADESGDAMSDEISDDATDAPEGEDIEDDEEDDRGNPVDQ